MRTGYLILTIGGISVFSVIPGIVALEYNREQSLCRSSNSRVDGAHDAINAIRNYRGGSNDLVEKILSRVRQSETFQSDGYSIITQNENGHLYDTGGGWHVEEWTHMFIFSGYSVDFEYFDREFRTRLVEIKCDVLECGAIDRPNCLTLGPG
jgi:hypothetical protein